MNEDGFRQFGLLRGNVNGDEFLDFVEKDLLPILMPFAGINPNSIVILDNCSVHHIPRVVSMITEVGALITKALAVSLKQPRTNQKYRSNIVILVEIGNVVNISNQELDSSL